MISSKYHKVAIHGVPRSGTSWLGEVLNSAEHVLYRYQPLFSYAHKDFLTEHSSSSDVERFFDRLVECEDDFTNQLESRRQGKKPSFRKRRITHVVYKEVRYMNILQNMMSVTNDVMLIAIVRNPLAVLDSWFRAPREFRWDLGWRESEEWCHAAKKNLGRSEEYFGFEKWKEAANLFLELSRLYPDRVKIVSYLDLLKNPAEETGRIFRFAKLPVTEQTTRFLRDSTSKGVDGDYAVYRCKRNDLAWKGRLPEEIVALVIDELKETPLERFLQLK